MKKQEIRSGGHQVVWRVISVCVVIALILYWLVDMRSGDIPDPAADGPVVKKVVSSRVLDINRRYNAMEGPFDNFTIELAPLLGSSPNSTELWWFKGAKVEVTDEKGELYGQDFLCHANVEVDMTQRQKFFPTLDTRTYRVITFTQGCTEFVLPRGTGVPVSSGETWNLTFQTLNFNRDGHFRVRERMILYFVRDRDLKHPLKALKMFTPYVAVSLDEAKGIAVSNPDCPCCLPVRTGLNAPNNVPNGVFKLQESGSTMTGHWVVPQGEHEWTTPLTTIANSFPAHQDAMLYAAWGHVHPYCTELELVEHKPGCQADVVVKSVVETRKGQNNLGLNKIGGFTSEKGMPLLANSQYELRIKYLNDSGHDVDSMGILGLFISDPLWQKPGWVNGVATSKEPQPAYSCGAPVPATAGSLTNTLLSAEGAAGQAAASGPRGSGTPAGVSNFPLFDAEKDGPVERGIIPIEIKTTAGVLEGELRGDWAPQNVTQMKRLIEAKAFSDLPFYQRVPNFICQTNLINLRGGWVGLIRRLPLERRDDVKHVWGVLSMGHWEDPNSGLGSFSIMLSSAAHLDGKFTVFGRVTPSAHNKQVMEALMKAVEAPAILSIDVKSAEPKRSGKKTAGL